MFTTARLHNIEPFAAISLVGAGDTKSPLDNMELAIATLFPVLSCIFVLDTFLVLLEVSVFTNVQPGIMVFFEAISPLGAGDTKPRLDKIELVAVMLLTVD